MNIRAAEADVRRKCDITLVYVEPLVFGEIKKIKKPIKLPVSINLDTALRPSTKPEVPETTEVKNFERKRLLDKFRKTRKRTDWSDPTKTTTITLPPPPKQSIVMPTCSDTDTPTHSYTLRTHKKQEVVRCNPRPARSTCNNMNYSNMDNSSEQTSPPRKHKPANLMRYPSATVISAHKRMKEKSKRTGKPMKESTEVDPSTETDDKTISDNKSTDTSINNNNKETPGADNTKSDNNPGNTNSAKHDNNNNELMYPVCNNTTTTTTTLSTSSNQIITTTGTGINMHPTTMTVDQYLEQQLENDTTEHSINLPETGNSTVDATVDALQGKTTPEKIAIESLLNIGDSLEYEDHKLEENALLMPVDRPPAIPIEAKGVIPTEPVNPELPPVPTLDTPPHSKGNDMDTTEILETGTPDNVIDNQEEPLEVKTTTKKKTKKIKKTVRKNKKKKNMNTPQNDAPGEKKDMKREPKPIKKGKLITQTFVLKRRSRPKWKFYCVIGKCKKTCTTRKELNNHHLTTHPRIVCDICNKLFDTPNSMHRHRYSYKKPKHFCADCGKGFYFESELTSH